MCTSTSTIGCCETRGTHVTIATSVTRWKTDSYTILVVVAVSPKELGRMISQYCHMVSVTQCTCKHLVQGSHNNRPFGHAHQLKLVHTVGLAIYVQVVWTTWQVEPSARHSGRLIQLGTLTQWLVLTYAHVVQLGMHSSSTVVSTYICTCTCTCSAIVHSTQ